jgi:hypothetical protein
VTIDTLSPDCQPAAVVLPGGATLPAIWLVRGSAPVLSIIAVTFFRRASADRGS